MNYRAAKDLAVFWRALDNIHPYDSTMPNFTSSDRFTNGVIIREGADADYIIIEPKIYTSSRQLTDTR